MIDIVEDCVGHTPLPIVQEKFVTPIATLTEEVARLILVIVGVPGTTPKVDHVPVPIAGTVAAKTVGELQTDMEAITAGMVGLISRFIMTVSNIGAQPPPLICQTNVLTPAPRAVTVVVPELIFANVPDPETTLHVPVPLVGVFAAITAEVVQTLWSAPAFAFDKTFPQPILATKILLEPPGGEPPNGLKETDPP